MNCVILYLNILGSAVLTNETKINIARKRRTDMNKIVDKRK